MAETYTVKWGDTLSELAVKYGTTVANLVKLNNIKDPDYIVVGQQLKLSGEATKATTTTAGRAVISVFGLQSNTDRTMYAAWDWSKGNTEKYEVMWYYDTGDDVWFIGNDGSTEHQQSLYTAPSNAIRVKFKVKPVSKTKTVNGNETSYWSASWSTEKIYSFSNNPPSKPDAPTVSIEGHTLTASLDNLNVNATHIQFQVIKDDESIFSTGRAQINYGAAAYSCTITAGSSYKVRCRSVKGSESSEWSTYSSSVDTVPLPPTAFTTCKATSDDSIILEWPAVKHAKSYELEYATNKNYFDTTSQTTTVSGIEFTQHELIDLTTGETYFFRVRAVNDKGESAWSELASTVLGEPPAAPTTWSSTTTAITGEPLNLYWVHNSEDGSSQTFAELELYIDGVKETHTIQNTADEDEKDKTSVYAVDTGDYPEGTKLQWRVRTAGVTKVYGEWSIQRTIDVYTPPTLELSVTGHAGSNLETLALLPFYISGLAGPSTQAPIGYHVSIISNEIYEGVDGAGNRKTVNAGEAVYSQYFDTNDRLLLEISPGDVNLENNVSYTVKCVVTMNSGLTAESTYEFYVAWSDEQYEPNAEISYDKETYVAYIQPYCQDEYGNLLRNVMLAVYRREYDGTFTKLIDRLYNSRATCITDPHPALDYARYRIVATSLDTGAISYYDVPGYPINCSSVVIQWDEKWNNSVLHAEDSLDQSLWSGSMLVLPYNVDVSDKNKPDVQLIEYLGRKHPVSYYGTQVGESSTWNVQIPKEDTETIFALRRLQKWMSDVYVREPSGSGYWANIAISFSLTHCEVTVPVTIDVVRVEGGV